MHVNLYFVVRLSSFVCLVWLIRTGRIYQFRLLFLSYFHVLNYTGLILVLISFCFVYYIRSYRRAHMTSCPHTLPAKNACRANSQNVFSKCQTMDKAQKPSRLMLNYV